MQLLLCILFLFNLINHSRTGETLIGSWKNEAAKFLPDLKVADLQSLSPVQQIRNVDILLVQKSVLQRPNGKSCKLLDRTKFTFLIVDEAQTWVRGQPNNLSTQLRYLRTNLLPRAKAVYHLSGTPFMGKIKWDYIQLIKSLATSGRRSTWSVALDDKDRSSIKYDIGYTDNQLSLLDANWEKTPDPIKTKLLIPVMLRRTLQTIIDGQRAVEKNYFENMVVDCSGEIDIEDIQGEITLRNKLLDEYIGRDPMVRVDRYIMARYLAWTSKAIKEDWKNRGRDSETWWEGFTLEDAKEYERGRRLVEMLQCLKARGKKPVIFAFYGMHQQFAAQVR